MEQPRPCWPTWLLDSPQTTCPRQDRVALGQQRAGAAISLLRLGEVEKSHGAFQIQDDPESLTQFVHRCRDRGVTAKELVNSLHKPPTCTAASRCSWPWVIIRWRRSMSPSVTD